MKLYLASGNAHKVQEFQALADASGLAIEIVSAKTVGGMPPVVEDTGTFIGNARKKALALKSILPPDAWVLADDSGLCVDTLGGEPGVESAYYAGPLGDSAANLAKLIEIMRDVPEGQRQAHFTCVLILIDGTGRESTFEGRCAGILAREPRGGHGFGYDPIFIPEGFDQTFGELPESVKQKISHRFRAFEQIIPFLRDFIVI